MLSCSSDVCSVAWAQHPQPSFWGGTCYTPTANSKLVGVCSGFHDNVCIFLLLYTARYKSSFFSFPWEFGRKSDIFCKVATNVLLRLEVRTTDKLWYDANCKLCSQMAVVASPEIRIVMSCLVPQENQPATWNLNDSLSNIKAHGSLLQPLLNPCCLLPRWLPSNAAF